MVSFALFEMLLA